MNKYPCGSLTLYLDGNDVVCEYCGYRIKNYKELELLLGSYEFKKFFSKIKKD